MAADEEVKLFGLWGSPFSRRVEIALKMKGVEYKFIEEDLSNKSPSLVKYNPVHKQIPVLLHNGKPIAESIIIVEYIGETWKSGPSFLPGDPHERAIARFWAKFIDDKCIPTIFKACWSRGQEKEQAIKETNENLKTLDNELQNKKFFGGETIGFVDIVANFFSLWFGILQETSGNELCTKEEFPKLSQWVDTYLDCDIIKTAMPPRDDLLVVLSRPTSK